jgi:preprotein translocase subunit YajC
MYINPTLLEAAAPQGGGSMQLILLVGIIIIFYFFMIRPQMQRQKKEKEFRSSLAKGDKVITIGGIYGRIAEVEDKSVLLEVDNNLKLRIDRNAIREKQAEK